MAEVKRVVCLADSRKDRHRCVAGIEIADGRQVGWIRLVTKHENGVVYERERRYEDGTEPRVLDIMDVPLLESRSMDWQPENWLLDTALPWRKVGHLDWKDLRELTDAAEPLWIDTDGETGCPSDRVRVSEGSGVPNSLRLIYLERLTLYVAVEYSKLKTRGILEHAGARYSLVVTDPRYESAYQRQGEGRYEVGESFVTVSLGEPFKGDCYKLIAAIIEPTGPPPVG
ncbi:MAG: hypothetical protein FJX72_07260 [Armatimonadetes bacterium]|nr:hypothetical protein [Armatimonadota bacterium]